MDRLAKPPNIGAETTLDLSSNCLHHSAIDLLDSLQEPSALEVFTVSQLESVFVKLGYQSESAAEVTLGWSRKAGGHLTGASNMALVVTADQPGRIISVTIGSEGAYDIYEMAKDFEHINPDEQSAIARYLQVLNPNVSERFRMTWEKIRAA